MDKKADEKERIARIVMRLEDLNRRGIFTQGDLDVQRFFRPAHMSDVFLSGMSDYVQDVIVGMILRRIFDAKFKREPWTRSPIFVFVEEAHRFAAPPDEGGGRFSRDILARIAAEGAKFGVFLTVISQRPRRLDPDILANCSNLAILRVVNAQDQRTILKARRRQLDLELKILDTEVDQKKQEIAEIQGRLSDLEQNLKLAEEQLSIAQPLMKKGLYAKVDFIKLQRELVRLKGELNALNLSLPRVHKEAEEARQTEIELALHEERTMRAPYFVEYVRQQMVSRYGADRIYSDGMQVHTTLDWTIQKEAEEAALRRNEAPSYHEIRVRGRVDARDRDRPDRRSDGAQLDAEVLRHLPRDAPVLRILGRVEPRADRLRGLPHSAGTHGGAAQEVRSALHGRAVLHRHVRDQPLGRGGRRGLPPLPRAPPPIRP